MIRSTALPFSGRLDFENSVTTDPPRFEDLIRRTAPRMLRVATRLVYPDRDLAEDLVQEAVIQALIGYRSGKFRMESIPAAQAWLMKSLMLQFLMNRRKRLPTTGNDDSLFNTLVEPERDYAGEWDRRRIITEALDRLSPDQRAVVVLVDIEEYSYEEAASMLDLPVGTLKSRLNRARWALAQPFADAQETF